MGQDCCSGKNNKRDIESEMLPNQHGKKTMMTASVNTVQSDQTSNQHIPSISSAMSSQDKA